MGRANMIIPLDFNIQTERGVSVRFLFAEISDLWRPRTAIVTVKTAGQSLPELLQVDFEKQVFVNRIAEMGEGDVLDESTLAKIIDSIAKQLPGNLEFFAHYQLLPEMVPEMAGLDIAASYVTQRVTADFVDLFLRNDGTLLVACGRAAGLSARATIAALEARTTIRAFASFCDDPGEILTRTNKVAVPSDHFVEAHLGVLDPRTNAIRVCNAGGRAFILTPTCSFKGDRELGIPLGVMPGHSYSLERPIQLDVGDLMIMCTDGIVETRSCTGEFFGEKRLIEYLHSNSRLSAADMSKELLATLARFRSYETLQDNLTIVVMKAQMSGSSSELGSTGLSPSA